MRKILLLTFLFTISSSISYAQTTDAVTEKEVRLKYTTAVSVGEKIKILIVPGHDDEYTGTGFSDYSEDDLNLEISDTLYTLLSSEPAFQVERTRTQTGYTPEFVNYFGTERLAVEEFRKAARENYQTQLASGFVAEQGNQVFHNNAQPEVAYRLAAINKYANDKDFDMVLHLHINDSGGRLAGVPGKYTGFTIYIPERQFSNSAASRSLATSLNQALSKVLTTSNHPGESVGITEDRELIAIGSNNSLQSGAVLIEYGYIYEPQYTTPLVRTAALNAYARETYRGIMNFFGVQPKMAIAPQPLTNDLTKGMVNNPSVLSLQTVLSRLGFYPPLGQTLSTCAVAGNFGPCTERAVKAFQASRGLSQVGRVGPQTRAAINSLR